MEFSIYDDMKVHAWLFLLTWHDLSSSSEEDDDEEDDDDDDDELESSQLFCKIKCTILENSKTCLNISRKWNFVKSSIICLFWI